MFFVNVEGIIKKSDIIDLEVLAKPSNILFIENLPKDADYHVSNWNVSVIRDGKTVIEVKGLDDEKVAAAYKKIKALEQKVTEEYFKKNYYQRFTTHDQQTGIKVDHVNIAQKSVADFKVLKPIILDKISSVIFLKV